MLFGKLVFLTFGLYWVLKMAGITFNGDFMERLEYLVHLKWDGNVGSEAKVREFAFQIDTNTDGHNKGLTRRSTSWRQSEAV
jgi:hypothetical protein